MFAPKLRNLLLEFSRTHLNDIEANNSLKTLMTALEKYANSLQKYDRIDGEAAFAFLEPSFIQTVDAETLNLFWENELSQVFTGISKLKFLHINDNTLQALKKTHVLSEDGGTLENEYLPLFNNLRRIKQIEKDNNQRELWELLILSGKPEALDYAFSNLNVTPLTTNKQGDTVAHLAVLSCSLKQIKQAITLQCDIQASNHEGLTPLHYSACYNLRDMTLFLIQKCSVSRILKDKADRTARDIAYQANAKDVAELLDSYTKENSRQVAMMLHVGIKVRGENEPIYDYEKAGELILSLDEIKNGIDFSLIAKRLSSSTAHYVLQAAEDLTEAKGILAQHSYYKHAGAYYAVKFLVDIDDLKGPFSEKELYDRQYKLADNAQKVKTEWEILNARGGRHWVLRSNTHIAADKIQSIELIESRVPIFLPQQVFNDKFCGANTPEIDKWQACLDEIKNYLSAQSFYGVSELLGLCKDLDTFKLNKFKDIAKGYMPINASKLFSLFYWPAKEATAFYQKVESANTLYEIAQWIHERKDQPFAVNYLSYN